MRHVYGATWFFRGLCPGLIEACTCSSISPSTLRCFSGVYAPASLKPDLQVLDPPPSLQFFRGLCPGLIEAASVPVWPCHFFPRFSGVYAPASLKLVGPVCIGAPGIGFSGVYAPASLKPQSDVLPRPAHCGVLPRMCGDRPQRGFRWDSSHGSSVVSASRVPGAPCPLWRLASAHPRRTLRERQTASPWPRHCSGSFCPRLRSPRSGRPK